MLQPAAFGANGCVCLAQVVFKHELGADVKVDDDGSDAEGSDDDENEDEDGDEEDEEDAMELDDAEDDEQDEEDAAEDSDAEPDAPAAQAAQAAEKAKSPAGARKGARKAAAAQPSATDADVSDNGDLPEDLDAENLVEHATKWRDGLAERAAQVFKARANIMGVSQGRSPPALLHARAVWRRWSTASPRGLRQTRAAATRRTSRMRTSSSRCDAGWSRWPTRARYAAHARRRVCLRALGG